MAYEIRNNTASLFKNEDKREGKKDPDYKGSANIEGTHYWLNAWLNTAASGQKYMALNFKAKEPRQDAPAAEPTPSKLAGKSQPEPDFNDDLDIPF